MRTYTRIEITKRGWLFLFWHRYRTHIAIVAILFAAALFANWWGLE
jgi:hypothetical protein